VKIPKKMTNKQRREFNRQMNPRKEVERNKWKGVLKNFKPKGGE
jgi:hypothetical protein